MHRFYLPPQKCQGETLVLEDREAHHAISVLRVRQGEKVAVLNGIGDEFTCAASEVGRKTLSLSVLAKKHNPPPPCQLTLLHAIPKGKTMETVVQKATELGAGRVVPLIAERSVVLLDADSAVSRVDKWRTSTIEAIKQCGSCWLPRVDPPISPAAFLARGEVFELSLVASLQTDARHPRQYFQSYFSQLCRPPKTVCVWIGPEGDFSPSELVQIQKAGGLPITLGPLTLRSETAAVYCLSVLSSEWQWAVTCSS